jgi:peptidoglycan/xylan/chitin deacetylase (PgdA/CDA1 family)
MVSGRWWHARGFRFLVLAAVAILASTGVVILKTHDSLKARKNLTRHDGTSTVVSLTFDDGQASQYSTLAMLSSRGMVGTYYINSAMVGSSAYYMSWPEIADLAKAGNEIAGHTLHHTRLTAATVAQATKEVCDDRTNLINKGFAPVASFAYPEAASNPAIERIVRGCGYTNARAAGSISCASCPYAETIPPADPYRLRTPEGITSSTTLANLQSYVTRAENHGGGWVIFAFHGICDDRCTKVNSMSPSIFTGFLDWLAPRSANGTVVRTVGQVSSGRISPQPATSMSGQ